MESQTSESQYDDNLRKMNNLKINQNQNIDLKNQLKIEQAKIQNHINSPFQQPAMKLNQNMNTKQFEAKQRQQRQWIKKEICSYEQGDQFFKKVKVDQVSNSHHVNFFKGIGRVISVFNDDIVYNPKEFYYGTGSIINQRIVLTSAHILRHSLLNAMADYVYFEIQSGVNNQKHYIPVKRYAFHKDYNDEFSQNKENNDISQKHDIAILILEENNLIKPQMTLQVQLSYNYKQQAQPIILVAGYPFQFNSGAEPFKLFWDQIKPSYEQYNFLLYQNVLGKGCSGSPLMIKSSEKKQSRNKVFAVHKGQIRSKSYSVCLNLSTNKLNEYLKKFSINDTNRKNCLSEANQKVKRLEVKIESKQSKLLYTSQVLIYDDIRWSKQIKTKLELNSFLQNLQEADSFKRGMQQIKNNINDLLKKEEQQTKCLFRQTQWNYVFKLFKNLYLNDNEQQKLLNLINRMMQINFQFQPNENIGKQFQQIGQLLHQLWCSVYFKTRSWCKQNGINTRNNLNEKANIIREQILQILKKGYQEDVDFKLRSKKKNQYILRFYYYNKNLQKADRYAIDIEQDQITSEIIHIKGLIMSGLGKNEKALQYFKIYQGILQKSQCVYQGQFFQKMTKEASNLNSIGLVYYSQGIYEQALTCYQRCLQIQEILKGKDSIDCAVTLNNMGLVYENIGDYEKSFGLYNKCLQIKRAIKGNDSIDCAITLNNIGLVYERQCDYEQALDFYKQCLQIQERLKGKNSIDCATTLNNMGFVLYKNQGKYEQALECYKRCLQIQEIVKGKDSINCAITLNNIGLIYKDQGHYEQAHVFYKRCLQIQQRLKGKQSIDCATTLNNIGSVYDSQGDYIQSLAYYKRCLSIKERVKGNDSIDCATTLNNMGSVYGNQGDYEQALTCYKRCLQIQEIVKGNDSIDCATTLSYIGSVYYSKKDYKQALDFFKRCLSIQERVKGKDFIDSAITLNNMGEVYESQGDYMEAFACYKRCLQIQEIVKGKNSIDCAATLNNMGMVYKNQDNYDQAISFFALSLQIYEKTNKKDCFDCVTTLSNMGSVYNSQGNYEQALTYYKRCLQIQEIVKGKDSINCATTLNNIGLVYKSQEDYQQALAFFSLCLQIQQKLKGEQSIDCAITLNNIGSVYDCQGDYIQSLAYYERCLQIQERVKGNDSIDCATTLNNMGSAYDNQSNYEQALTCYKRCLQIQEIVKGNDSFDCAATLNNLGWVYYQQKDYEQALDCYKRCLLIQERVKGNEFIDSAITLHNIGLVYEGKGDYEQAQTFYKKSLQIEKIIKQKTSFL